MSNVTEHIDVDVPVRTAYNQWTQFEEFPRFMEGVEEIRQLDDRRLFWKTKIAGVVTFRRIADTTTRVTVQLDAEPEGAVEKVGDALGLLKRRVKGDLDRFKALIEGQGTESGAWRGEIEQPGEATGASGQPQVQS